MNTIIKNKTIKKEFNAIISNSLKIRYSKIGNCINEVVELFGFLYGGSVSPDYLESVVRKKLGDYIASLRSDLYVLIEAPYVDRVYRDTYYNYYSTKHHKHLRDCCRISFFETNIDLESFFNSEKKVDLEKAYLGYLILRPTFPQIIGRSTIDPKARLSKDEIIICRSKNYQSTVFNIKLKPDGFPHSSQDSQMLSCAETTIWALLEYFGNKYPDYKPVLPSVIHQSLRKYSYKRQIPSEGLTIEQVSYSLREFGFSTKIYNCGLDAIEVMEFQSILSIYIESGIPVIAALDDHNKMGHAINIIGRKRYSKRELLANLDKLKKIQEKGNVYDFHTYPHKFVFMDDNYFPYQVSTLSKPYFRRSFPEAQIEDIVVPLYTKIYLDASVAHRNAKKIIGDSGLITLDKNERYIERTFLASSRSYKDYMQLSGLMPRELVVYLGALPMPKFIWITEIATVGDFVDGFYTSFILQDATHPTEKGENVDIYIPSILAIFNNGSYFSNAFAKLIKFRNIAAPNRFKFFNNLK